MRIRSLREGKDFRGNEVSFLDMQGFEEIETGYLTLNFNGSFLFGHF